MNSLNSLNSLKIDQPQVIFITGEAEIQHSPPPSRPIIPSATMPLLLAQLIGLPIQRWAIEGAWTGGRVAAVRVEPELGVRVCPMCMPSRPLVQHCIVIPVPMYDSFHPYSVGFVRTMQTWSKHLLAWKPQGLVQKKWFQTGEQLAQNVLGHAQDQLCWSAEDQKTIERLLWNTLAMPSEFMIVPAEEMECGGICRG